MSEARAFIVGQSRGKGYVKMVCKPAIMFENLELEEARFRE
jgi:hypothetical protein